MISNVIMKTVLTPQTSQNSLGESQGSYFENQPIQGKFILMKPILFRDMNSLADATG